MSALQPPLFIGGILNALKNILPQLPKIFKTAIPKPAVPKLPKLPKVSGGTKAGAVILGTSTLATATVLQTQNFLQTPEGQATLDSRPLTATSYGATC